MNKPALGRHRRQQERGEESKTEAHPAPGPVGPRFARAGVRDLRKQTARDPGCLFRESLFPSGAGRRPTGPMSRLPFFCFRVRRVTRPRCLFSQRPSDAATGTADQAFFTRWRATLANRGGGHMTIGGDLVQPRAASGHLHGDCIDAAMRTADGDASRSPTMLRPS